MSKVVLRPDSDIESKRATVVGATTAHEALSDDSDATYCNVGDGTPFTAVELVGFGGYEPPVDAVTKLVSVRMRAASSGGTVPMLAFLMDGSYKILGSGNLAITNLSPAVFVPGAQIVGPIATAAVNELNVQAGKNVGEANLLLYELYLDVTYVEKPEVFVSKPTGTVENTNRPKVQWAVIYDPDGGAQTNYEVRIFSESVYEGEDFDPETSVAVAASGLQSSIDQSWTPGTVLADGNYRAYVRAAVTVNGSQLLSDWAYRSFAVEVALPAVPDLVLEGEAASARNGLAVVKPADTPATTDGFEVQWSHDGGASWVELRTAVGAGLLPLPSGDEYVLAKDYEAPNGEAVKYRARAYHEYEGARAWSDWKTGEVSWESSDRWLKHPTDPSLNVKVEPYSYPGATRTARMGNFQPLGRTDPVVVSDTRLARTGSLVLWVETESEREALDALLSTLAPLLLQMGAQDERKDRWVQAGTVDTAPIVDKLGVVDTLETLEWVEVGRP